MTPWVPRRAAAAAEAVAAAPLGLRQEEGGKATVAEAVGVADAALAAPVDVSEAEGASAWAS